jgi:hypothetical protein
LKSITQLPSAVKDTTPELNEQPVLEESSVIATVKPDDAVGVGV